MKALTSALVIVLAAMGGFSAAQADSVFVGGEMGWIDRPVQRSITSAEAVRAEAIRSHRDGAMLHSEVTPLTRLENAQASTERAMLQCRWFPPQTS
jgi:hypothetical protein